MRYPDEMVIRTQSFNGLISATYNGIADAVMNLRAYFSHRSIFIARNNNVAKINTAVFNTVFGETHEFFNNDKVDDEEGANVIRTKLLNRRDATG